MGKIRKVLALVIAMVVMAAMSMMTFAATITINPQTPENASADSTAPTYNVYKMMEASVGTGDAVSYYVEDQTKATALDSLTVTWTDANEASYTDDLFTVTKAAGADRWYVTINKKTGGDAFTGAEVAAALQTIKANAIETKSNQSSPITITGDGYVLIESSLGTVLAADTVTTKEITEKNTYPGINKTEDKSNAEIGEVVTYTVPVSIPENVAEHDILVVDTITNGLTMNTAITVSGAGTDDAAALTSLTFEQTGTVAANSTANPPVKAATIYTATIPAAKVIANKGRTLNLVYTATVNENAIVNDPEINKVHLEYDNFKTVDVEVQVKTFGFDLLKVDGANANIKLKDVVFTLTNSDGEYYTEPTDNSSVNEDRFTTTKATIATGEGGTYTFEGLHAGEYTLTEISNPNPGYNLLDAPIVITVGDDGKISYTLNGTAATDQVQITVENNKGSTLPSTGGMGTTIFYVIGGLLVLAAAIVLISRRKVQQ